MKLGGRLLLLAVIVVFSVGAAWVELIGAVVIGVAAAVLLAIGIIEHRRPAPTRTA